MVTHNIEEAVLMCDRILVFSSNPGRVAHELKVPFRIRATASIPPSAQMVDDIYGIMTRRKAPEIAHRRCPAPTRFHTTLHPVGTNLMAGLLETLATSPITATPTCRPWPPPCNSRWTSCCRSAKRCTCWASPCLRKATSRSPRPAAALPSAETEDRKEIFAEALRTHVPLITEIRNVIDQRSNHRAAAVRFRDQLEDHMSPEYAEETLRTVIAWGRYAEIFEYDEEAQQFGLEEEDEEEHEE